MPLLEAVPNVSEGKNPDVLRTLQKNLQQTPGITLLHTDSNPSANRTVFTLLGEPDALCEALFHFISCTTRLLDMRTQHGKHPRLGAVDVCPLIPLQDISLEETAAYARRLGQRVGNELQMPVYLYEAAAANPARRNLADIRRGEYENLAQKLQQMPPDFGPTQLTQTVQKTGACIIGARPFLIAFNINLNTRDVLPAKQIAAKIRQSGGGLPGVKAIGWYMENFDRAQISCNITDFRKAPLHTVFEKCQQYATKLGLKATGCELVGLIPLEALLNTGRHYAPAQTNPAKLIQTAAEKLNLCEVKPFIAEQQILEIKAGLN